MRMISNENGNGGVSVFGLLGVSFIVLKLLGYIDWAWIWVLAPFWSGLALFIIILFIYIVLHLWLK